MVITKIQFPLREGTLPLEQLYRRGEQLYRRGGQSPYSPGEQEATIRVLHELERSILQKLEVEEVLGYIL